MIATLAHFISQNIYLIIFAYCALIAVLREVKKRQDKQREENDRDLRRSWRTNASQRLLVMRRRSEDEQWNRILEDIGWSGPRDCEASRERVS